MSAPEPRTIVLLGGFAESLVRFRGELIKRFVAGGHRVIACAPHASDELQATLADYGADYRHVPFDRAGMNPLRDLRTVASLARLFKELKPDILLSYTIKPVLYGGLAGMVAGIPERYAMITGVGHAFVGTGVKAWIVNRVARALYKLVLGGCRGVIFQNPDDRALFESLGLLKSTQQATVINGSGVDVDAFAQHPLPAKPSFLLIARLTREKGIYEYVEAARELKARYPEVAFRLAGWIDENPSSIKQSELDRWIEEGVIDYLGALTDVRPALAGSMIYVLPSTGEGTPRSILEALAVGRPIVTSDAPGCRETVIEGQNGYLVRHGDAASLSEALERFLADPNLAQAMAKRSRAMAEAKYDVHKVNLDILRAMHLKAA